MTSVTTTDEKAPRFPDEVFDWCVRWVPEVRDSSMMKAMGAFAKKVGRAPVALRWAVVVKRPVDTQEQRRAVLHDRAYTVTSSFDTCAKVLANQTLLRQEDRKRMEGVNTKRQVPAIITVKVEGSEAAPGRSDTRMFLFKRGARAPTSQHLWDAMMTMEQTRCLVCKAPRATLACAGGCKWNYCSEQHRDEHANRHKTLCDAGAKAVTTHAFEQLVDGLLGIER